MASHASFNFLQLPYELRLEIYRHCVPTGHYYFVPPPSSCSYFEPFCPKPVGGDKGAGTQSRALPALLLVCRQISDEVLDVFYGDNVFQIPVHRDSDDQEDVEGQICKANRRKMRKVMLLVTPSWLSYHGGAPLDEAFWDGILPNLQTLWIVAEQPRTYDLKGRLRIVAAAVKEWIEWLTPLLDFIAGRLRTEATVLIDVNGAEETVNLIQNRLPQVCRQVRTETGDSIFQRSQHSSP